MKKIITGFAFFFSLQLTAFSQTTATWMGGTPGKAQNWNCATNWKEGRVPDENAQVIIPSDLIYYPVIDCSVPDIDAILVSSGAQVTIQAGASLTIAGESGRFDGLTIFGKIVNKGQLRVASRERMMPDQLTMIQGNGIVHE